MGGGFIEWKGYTPPKKNPPKYPFATMKQLRQHAEQNNISIAEVILANEMAIPGRSEDEVYAFIDKITKAMVGIVKSGLNCSGRRIAGTDQAATLKPPPFTNGHRTIHSSRTAESACCRRTLWLEVGGKRARSPGSHCTDRRLSGSHAVAGLWTRARADVSCRRIRSAKACWRRRPSATSASTMRRYRRPRADARPRSASPPRWQRL